MRKAVIIGSPRLGGKTLAIGNFPLEGACRGFVQTGGVATAKYPPQKSGAICLHATVSDNLATAVMPIQLAELSMFGGLMIYSFRLNVLNRFQSAATR